MRTITITAVLNGWTVQVGCQTLAYVNLGKLTTDINSYLSDPERTEKRILAEEGCNRKWTLGQIPQEPTRAYIGTATEAINTAINEAIARVS